MNFIKWLSTVHEINNIKFTILFAANAVYEKCVL
jgi:hypothetical protein